MPSTSVLASGTILKTNREVQSIDKVRMELLQGGDALSTWIQNELPEKFFLPMDNAIQAKYGKISSHVSSLPCFDVMFRYGQENDAMFRFGQENDLSEWCRWLADRRCHLHRCRHCHT